MNHASASAHDINLRSHVGRQSASMSHMPGVTVLNQDAEISSELRSWGRTMALFREQEQNNYLVEDFQDDATKKKHIKFIRKNARYLTELFGGQGDILQQEAGSYKICVSLSGTVHKIVSAEVRSEVYIPIAVYENNILKGGAYAYIWRCCSNEQSEKATTKPISKEPVTSIVTGMCMFGTNIVGIDQHGFKHPLTNTFYSLPAGACIESIELERDGLHPYEQMMLRTFELQLPMMKALGGGLPQKIFYQCVHAEYVLYGINAYIRGEMTLKALHAYAHHVSERVQFIREAIERSCRKYGFDFDGGKSTLERVFRMSSSQESAEDWVGDFLEMHGLQPTEITSDMPLEQRLTLIRGVFHRCLDLLASQQGADGEVWAHICSKLRSQNVEGKNRFDATSLLTLNFLNYAAKVAIVKAENPANNLCLIHPFHEKAMALSYRDIHSDRFGEILAINWIPPIFSHGSFKDGLYYLEDHKKSLAHLIGQGLLECCALETGAAAVGDIAAGQLARRHIYELLAEIGDARSQEKFINFPARESKSHEFPAAGVPEKILDGQALWAAPRRPAHTVNQAR
jgi:hypothetical protein